MKARVQHLVPLSRQALELLRRLRSLNSDSEYLFPLIRNSSRPLHACTLLNEMGWRSEAIERQMAHGVSDSVRRHYNYAQHLPERRIMMQAWADYLDDLRSALDEQTSTALFSRSASAHAVSEQAGVGTRQLGGPEITATP
jgi:hypothetical protein